jgi:hypothetical protein
MEELQKRSANLKNIIDIKWTTTTVA